MNKVQTIIQNDTRAIRPIHYLGSKLRMLNTIKEAIDYVDPTQGLICDLFSGSGTVSNYLIQYRDVIAVDIQNYSSVLCEASVNRYDGNINIDDIINRIKKSEKSKELLCVFQPILNYEKVCTEKAFEDALEALYEIIEKGSLYIYLNDPFSDLSEGLEKALSETKEQLSKKGLSSSEDTMITRYYGGLYFSFHQAVELDTIASFVFTHEGLLKTKMIAALLSATSEIVNTVGKQFAQPLKIRNGKGELKRSLKKKILQDRSIDTYSVFQKWLNYYFEIGTSHHTLSAICSDYRDALKRISDKDVKVVYADPPYTRYHYSRYYHVLETICLRDNPPITTTFPNGKGGISRAIYREGRHQSPFCIKSQAENAFQTMFESISGMSLPLVLSYSPFDASQAVTPRLQTIDQLLEMAKRYYQHVEIRSPGTFTHSKLNSTDKNFESNHEAELLIVCY